MEEVARPDSELRLLLRITRTLPRARGAVRVATAARKFYLRKKRKPVIADVMGFKMRLDPEDWVQGGLLFWPQLWDYHEFGFLARNLRPGDTFLDVGAHIGFNSLNISRMVGPSGLVLSIEAAPDLFAHLHDHLEMNHATNVRAINVAVSDSRGVMNLSRPDVDNSAGRSLLPNDKEGTPVQCVPLADIVGENGLTKIAGGWFEIAGSEFKALNPFFRDCGRDLWPRFLVVESNIGWKAKAGGDVFALLNELGYREERLQVLPSEDLTNRIFVLPT